MTMITRSASDARPSPVKRRKKSMVWLDLLPLEICSRIASMLPPCKPWRGVLGIESDPAFGIDLDFFTLAGVSDVQRRAVAASQDRILRAEQVGDFRHAEKLIRSWHEILGNDIREVRLSSNIVYTPSKAIRKVLSLPSIVKASIPHCGALLNALHAGRSVKQLNIEFVSHGLHPQDGDRHLLYVLESCCVRELRLVCTPCFSRPRVSCSADVYMEILRFSPFRNGPNCKSVRSLELLCHSSKLEKLANAVFLFPNLEHMRLEHCLKGRSAFDGPDELAPFRMQLSSELGNQLLSLRSVSMVNCGTVDYFATILGECLTTIVSQEPLSRVDVQKLEGCPNLECVDIMLERGAETEFPSNLCSLRSLSLTWGLEDNTNELYYSPHLCFLFETVWRNEDHMEELRLKNANIPLVCLDEILLSLSTRLRRLQVPVVGEIEPFPTQVAQLMLLIMKHNPNIEELIFGSGSLSDSVRFESGCAFHEHQGFFYADYSADCEFCALWKQFDVFWQILNRRLPRLSPASIDKLRSSLGMYERTKGCAMQ